MRPHNIVKEANGLFNTLLYFHDKDMSMLEEFGKLISEDLRDSALNRCLDIESSWGNNEKLRSLTQEYSNLSVEQKSFVKHLVTECIDAGIHDFLFALAQEKNEVELTVKGVRISDMSYGLQGEIFTKEGWFKKFSQHGEKGI